VHVCQVYISMCGGRLELKSVRLEAVSTYRDQLPTSKHQKARKAEDSQWEGTFFVEELEEEWRRCLSINLARYRGHRGMDVNISPRLERGMFCKVKRPLDFEVAQG
jgi:hypothetical protein